jgi:hypothetical protein
MRKAHAIAILLLAVLLGLSGCSYRPLYGTTAESEGVAATLSAIAIPEAETRIGQIIRSDLLSGMAGGEVDRYTLILKPEVKKIEVVDKPLPNVTRQAVHLQVSYELVEIASGAAIHKGRTFAQTSFDLVRQPYADLQAEATASERAAHEVSADIRTRLAAFFTTRQP